MNFRSLSNPHHQTGFTLLEVMISLAILVFIAFGIYQATTETYKLRDTLSTEGNFHNGIRLATAIVQRDISLLYSPMQFSPELQKNSRATTTDPAKLQNLAATDLGRSTTYWSATSDVTGVRPSHFIGTENKISFISLSHIRIYKNSAESDLAKISYELKPDDVVPNTKMLVKTESPNVFIDDSMKDNLLKTYTLLHGIKKFTYTYYQRDGNTWKQSNSWDNDREETKNIYPDVIELSLEVIGPVNQKFEGKFKFRPEIPFNGVPETL